ncbi:MAG: V-type ATP synthase subunit I [Treponema sp.]|nr:V-type ATP synthase subunit I [Treponema sp.]
MKKVSLVVMDKYREISLKKLRETGVLHLEKKNVSSDTLAQLLNRKAGIESAIGLLQLYAAKAKAQKRAPGQGIPADHKRSTDFINSEGVPFSAEALDAPDGKRVEFFRHILNMEDKRKSLQEKVSVLSREQARIKGWGDFDPRDIQFLKENGVDLYLYELTPKALKSLPAGIPYIAIAKTKAIVYVVVPGGEVPGETPVEAGKQSFSEIDGLLAGVRGELARLDSQFIALSFRKDALEQELEAVLAQIEFQTASEGMGTLEDAPAQSTVSWLSGFIPGDKIDLLRQTAGENGWALVWDDPSPSDNPPTLLRNGPVARTLQPLLSFLGTVPGYREFDISPSYLLFFSVFFAMILGDAAYGALIMGAALALGFVMKKKNGVFPDVAKLLLLLSSTTIVWGTITGSWFMIPHNHLPLFLSALILPPFNNVGPMVEFPLFLQNVFRLPAEVPADEYKTRWSIMFLCFTIAITQLVLARGKRILRLLPSLAAVAQVGWLLFMLGLYFLVLTMLLGVAFPDFAPWLLGAGLALVLVFSEQHGGNFLVNVGKSFAGLFPLFLKTVSCFADIISYIRLFAVGLAGAMIGLTFNQMAFPAEGLGAFGLMFVVRMALAVVLVVFGHALNLALASLSVIVHGVRLNLLEYAGNHLEMEWSGYAYNPFALKQKNKL